MTYNPPSFPDHHVDLDERTLPSALVPSELLVGLNAPQREAVQSLAGPLLVVAGPGSGKTRVLTHRVAALLAAGVSPWGILVVTFTNKAAAELKSRLATRVGTDTASKLWVTTFHAACARILRYHYAEANLPRGFSICDSDDSKRLIKALLGASGALDDAQAVRIVASAISTAKNAGLSPDDVARRGGPREQAIARTMHAYQGRLQSMGAVDFDDLLLRTMKLLEHNEVIRNHYREKLRYVLVDEYQDTNVVQERIVRYLVDPARAELCCAGDFDQSIYGWRGASPGVLQQFSTTYPSAKVVILEQNYRSTKAIVEVSSAIIAPNPARYRPHLFTDNTAGAPVAVHEAADDRDEASWIVKRIKARTGRLSDFAILLRTNAQTRSLEEALMSAQIPYQLVGALKFYARAEIKDALSYLRVAANPHDNLSFERCANSPRRGVGEVALSSLIERGRATERSGAQQLDYEVQTASLPARSRAGLLKLHEAITAVRTAAEESIEAAVTAAVQTTGLYASLAPVQREGPDRQANLGELITAAARADADRALGQSADPQIEHDAGIHPAVMDFLESVALAGAEEVETPRDEVLLMTAHSSKGREFPHVIVAGVEDGYFPHERVDEDDLDEERRLLFVAVSRAQRTLALTFCRSRMLFGHVTARTPSPFLESLPNSVQWSAAPERAVTPTSFSSAYRPTTGQWPRRWS